MGKKGWSSDWVAPIFIVIAILAVWLSLTYLPLSSWGIDFDTSSLWVYMPWLLVFALGMYTLKKMVIDK